MNNPKAICTRVWLGVVLFALCALFAQETLAQESTQMTLATPAGSAVPRLVNYNGVLKDSGGRVVSETSGVTFAIYKDEQGGAPLWLETQNVRPDGTGHYTVQLGSASSQGLPAEMFLTGEGRWLGIQIAGEPEQARVLLVAVPYAMKAADAETIGGLPPSAFVLAAPPSGTSTGNAASVLNATSNGLSPALSGTGTIDYLPLWTSSTALGSSALFQTGSGSSAKIGINTTTPAAMLDVKGSVTIRSLLNLPAVTNATASAGADSNQIGFVASAFNSSSKAAVNQVFRWMAEPTGNNTSAPSATLNFLFGVAPSTPTETGLKINHKGVITFASGQTFPGTGTITQVNSGTGLLGGGSAGTVTLMVDSSLIPFLNAVNIFSGTQEASVSGEIGLAGVSDNSDGVYGSSSSGNGLEGESTTGTGIFGGTSGGIGVWGNSNTNYGVAGVTSSGNGVYGQVSTANQAGVVGRQEDSSGNWGLFAFGNIGASGTKSSVVPVDNGARQVALYAVESPGVWFEDYGSGKLVSGVATVTIDPAYAQTVNTGVEYHVFVTPEGDCEGLYVTAKTATGFEVRELHQGVSSVAFDYRIIALRRGYETKRLADVTGATPRAAIATPRVGQAGPSARTATAK